jgi:CHAD domain-containing protein
MAKQKDIKTTPWEPFARTAARVVRVRTEELFSHAEGVLDTEDIERVHDMRVASRRLRAVLEIFAACFPRAEYKSVLRDVKRLADALGERRDPDVHIAAMEEFAARQTAVNRPGIERLEADLRERQARANELLAAELERVAERDLHGRLLALSDAADAEAGGEEAAAEALAAADLSDDGAAPAAAPAPSSPAAATAAPSPDAAARATSSPAAPDLVAAAEPEAPA